MKYADQRRMDLAGALLKEGDRKDVIIPIPL